MNKLKFIKKKNSGRDASGKVVVRHQGGQHKRFIRAIDFKRSNRNIQGKVMAIEYDPNRSTDIALIKYADGDTRYILRPEGLKLNDKIIAANDADIKVGNAVPLAVIPIGTFVHNIELTPGKGGQLARSAGTYAIIQAREDKFVHLKMPSGEVRKVRAEGFATIGSLGNVEWKNKVFKKAGALRHRGIRPTVRGVAQNPRSHAHGGGEGRSGIGMSLIKTYAGRPAVGKTRKKTKYSNKYILQRRKGKRSK
jgi:large subunit ribosomal protein L2